MRPRGTEGASPILAEAGFGDSAADPRKFAARSCDLTSSISDEWVDRLRVIGRAGSAHAGSAIGRTTL
jgi:hypothetical protein